MEAIIFIIGLIVGCFIEIIMHKMSEGILRETNASDISSLKNNRDKTRILIVLTTGLMFLVSFLCFQLSNLFYKSIVLSAILIIIFFIDIRHQVIPDSMVVFTLITGIAFYFTRDNTIISSILGMLIGGGLLFLLALIPGAMGGGDVKFMFAVSSFLGLSRTLWALLLAFTLAAIISLILLLIKIKTRKDHIPFGPFLAVGIIISFLYFR